MSSAVTPTSFRSGDRRGLGRWIATVRASVARVEERGNPARVREILGDGTFGGAYERPDEEMLELWNVAVEEVGDLIERGW